MPRNSGDETFIHDIAQSREERAQAFAGYLREKLIDWQYRSRVWVTSATEVGKMLGVSDVTANDWLRGKTLPRREHCIRIAQVLGVPAVEVLEAAGYPATQDDSYNTYAALLDAVEQATTWSQAKRDQIRSALIEAISPTFSTEPGAAEWRELSSLVLHPKSPPTAKAERVARIIELWRHESGREPQR
jgi:transcriptional regulator with XRE-family HTH domain